MSDATEPASREVPSLQAVFDLTALHRLSGLAVEPVKGGVRFRGAVGEPFERADGLPSLHGGAIAMLLDTAATMAIGVETQRFWATADLRIDYLRPARLGEVEVVGEVLHAGNTIGRAHATLTDASGAIVARAIGTFVAERSGEQ